MRAQFYTEKVTPPTLSGIVQRKHILARIRQQNPVVTWITAPSGFGKTAVALQIAHQFSQHPLWYNIESIDQDPAVFFGFLKQAAIAQSSKCEQLPDFTTEYLMHLDAFAPRFFSALTDCLDTPVVLVLDDFQCLDQTAALHTILINTVRRMPESLRIVITSRGDIPALWTEIEARQTVEWIRQQDLRLGIDEIEELLRLNQQMDSGDENIALTRHLLRLSDGWISGIKLLLNQMERNPQSPQVLNLQEGQESLFRLLSSVVLERLDADTNAVLLRTAYLPFVPAWLANSICGYENAEHILNTLYQRGFFISKRSDENAPDKQTYVYHDLLRTFLQDEFKRRFDKTAQQDQFIHASGLFLNDGFIDEAIRLLIKAEQWHTALGHIEEYARTLYATGRSMTLLSLLQQIPDEILATSPRARYWLGVCLLPVDMTAGRELLEKTYMALKAEGDIIDAARCWAAVVDALWAEWYDCWRLDYWIDELEYFKPYLEENPELVPVLAKGAFAALSIRDMAHPEIQYWEKLNLEMLEKQGLPLDDMLMRSLQLMIYYTWAVGDRAKSTLVLQHLKRIFDGDRCSEVIKCIYHVVAATYENWFAAEQRACIDIVEKGLETSAANGLPFWDVPMINAALFRASAEEETDLISHYLEQLDQRLNEHSRPNDVAVYYFFRAYLWWLEGDYRQALTAAEKALALALDSGFSFSPQYYRLACARIHASMGNRRRALAYVSRVRRTARAYHSDNIEYMANMVAAGIIHENGRTTEALRYFSRAIAIGAAQRYNVAWWISSDTFHDLCNEALHSAVEPEKSYLQQRLAGHVASCSAGRCRVRVLGKLEIAGSADAADSRKLAKIPLTLLLHLIAVNHGNGITVEQALEILWPKDSQQKAYPRLKTTVQRLRKILGHESAIRFAEGRIMLNLPRDDVDSWALESHATRMKPGDSAWRARVFQLYGGNFQQQFTDSNELSIYKAHIEHQFSSMVIAMGKDARNTGDWQSVLKIFSAAQQRDKFNEAFLRGKLEALLKLGQSEEAIHEFRLYQKLWQSELGASLSAETEKLFAK